MRPLDPVSASVLADCASNGREASDAEVAIAAALVRDGLVAARETTWRGRRWREYSTTAAGERALRVHRAWVAAGSP